MKLGAQCQIPFMLRDGAYAPPQHKRNLILTVCAEEERKLRLEAWVGLKTLLMLLSLFFFIFPALSAPPPVVVVSLKPLHSWVCTLMAGRGVPLLLLDGKLSPHTATLRPQDVVRAKQAELMIWIGPSFEAPLAKLMGSLGVENVLTLEDDPEMDWLPQRQGCGHAHPHTDGHIWLDPVRGVKIVVLLADKLGEKDPSFRDLYQKNLAGLKLSLQKTHQLLMTRLSKLTEKPFFVLHDAYQYLENRYGLRAAGVVLLSADHPPSGKHLQAIQQQVKAQKKACLFLEPQLQYSSVVPFLRKLGVREGVLDPLGADIPEGPGFYTKLMVQIAAGFESCLCE